MGDTSIIPAPGGGMTIAGAVAGLLLSAPIAPSAGGITLAGVAPTVSKPSVTAMVPTIGSITLSGAAPTLTTTVCPVQSLADGANGLVYTWSGLANGAAGGQAPGTPVPLPGFRSAQFVATGTFGSGGSVQIEGSNDLVNWEKLSPTALTAAGSFASLGVQEFPRYYRPHVTAGDGTTAITVTGYFRCGP